MSLMEKMKMFIDPKKKAEVDKAFNVGGKFQVK